MRREIPNWLQSLYMFMVEKQKRIGMFSLGAGIEKFLALRKEKDVKKVFSFAQAVRFFVFYHVHRTRPQDTLIRGVNSWWTSLTKEQKQVRFLNLFLSFLYLY